MNTTHARHHTILILFGILSIIACVIAPLFGVSNLDVAALVTGTATDSDKLVFFSLRIPRVLFAFFVGASLSLCGVLFQALFRNPLASPFTMGVSSAAALGAALYFKVMPTLSIFGYPGATICAFVTALLSIGLIVGLARVRAIGRGDGVLLLGVALSFFCSSFVVFLQYISDFSEVFSITRWLMGSLDVVGMRPVATLSPFALAMLGISWFYARDLDLIAISDEFAISRGVNVARVEWVLFISASLLVAISVSLCGVIGFVGIMVPHMCRLMMGHNHRVLVPAAFLLGGIFITGCDLVSRTIIAPAEIPVGVITSLLGGPFFLGLLLHRTRQTTP